MDTIAATKAEKQPDVRSCSCNGERPDDDGRLTLSLGALADWIALSLSHAVRNSNVFGATRKVPGGAAMVAATVAAPAAFAWAPIVAGRWREGRGLAARDAAVSALDVEASVLQGANLVNCAAVGASGGGTGHS